MDGVSCVPATNSFSPSSSVIILSPQDIGFVGQLGKNELASAALATVWFNLWNSTMIGFMTAIDTLLSQSYGANQLENYSLWTGNSLMIIVPVTAVVSGAVALCGPCMKLFGQDHELADAAAEFSYRLIPGLFPYYLFKVQTKYLQSQNRLAPGVWIGLFANGFNALFNWWLIYAAGWGLMGAPWATSLTRLVEFVLLSLYMCVVVRGNDDIGGAVGDSCLGCAHHHLDNLHLRLPQLSIRGRDRGID